MDFLISQAERVAGNEIDRRSVSSLLRSNIREPLVKRFNAEHTIQDKEDLVTVLTTDAKGQENDRKILIQLWPTGE